MSSRSLIPAGSGYSIQAALDSANSGETVTLSGGEFLIDAPIILKSDVTLKGSAEMATRLVLKDRASCHLITNQSGGVQNVCVENLVLQGNSGQQRKLSDGPEKAQICGVYFFRSRNIRLENIQLFDIKQTGIHCTNCSEVLVRSVWGKGFGWSGIGLTGCENTEVEAQILDTGLETRHSAIHIDGGSNIKYSGRVLHSPGNGIMLDSAFKPLSDVVIHADVGHCMRGVGVIGGRNDNSLKNIKISGVFYENEQTGILISNSSFVCVENAVVEDNREAGIAFQGRFGGNDCLVSGCAIRNNNPNVIEQHPSKNNSFENNNFE